MTSRFAPFLLLTVLLSGCNGPRHVSPEEFKADYSKPIGTVVVTRYLGQKDGKAYIKISSMSSLSQRWSDEVVYVELSELDAAFRDSLPKEAAPERVPAG